MKSLLFTSVSLLLALSVSAVDFEFFKGLVEIPSSSVDYPQVNRATEYVKAYLEKHGVLCTVETDDQGRKLLFAATQPGKVQDYILAPHVDVVPESFPGQYAIKREGDKVMGRGVHDCKGRVAPVCETLIALAGKGVSVGAIFGADEELGGFTTTWMVEKKGYAARKMVIVVDSDFGNIGYATKGQLMVRATLTGKGGHSSAPWSCPDLITKLSKAVVEIETEWYRRHPMDQGADHWSDILTPTIIKSEGTALNRIPSEVWVNFNLRSVREEAKDEVIALIREKTGGKVEVVRYSPPCVSDPNALEVQRLRKVMQEVVGKEIPLERKPFATDARCFVSLKGVPVVNIGTVGGGSHAADEWDSLSSQDQLSTILRKFLSPRTTTLAITAGGDAFMVQGFPKSYSVDPKLKSWIASGDARLVNFETVVNDGSCRPAAWSGGTWSSMDPSVLPDFLAFGFNGCGCANNHSTDFSWDGLFLTMKSLRALNLPFAGIGENLQDATKAAYVKTPNGTVAFLSVSASFHPDAMAGWKTSRSPGRPGLSGLRCKETFLVTEKQLEWVKEIASETGINGNRELDIKTGFSDPDAPGTFQMRNMAFKVAEKPGRTSVCNANDLRRLTDAIREAKRNAAAVVVMPHAHMMRYKDVEEPAPFFVEFCRAAIDAGADAVVGGGTHQLKGIELRGGRPIFYSLGDFVFQNNVVPLAPPDFCEQYKVPLDSDAKTAFNARSKGGKVGLHAFRPNFLSVVPRVTLDAGTVVKVELLPIELHWKHDWDVNGLPRSADAEATGVILAALERTSKPYGTAFALRADGIIEIKR